MISFKNHDFLQKSRFPISVGTLVQGDPEQDRKREAEIFLS